jgi:hypothetical protein
MRRMYFLRRFGLGGSPTANSNGHYQTSNPPSSTWLWKTMDTTYPVPDRENTRAEDYRLVNLMIDEKPVQFTTASVTLSITWIGGPGTPQSVSRWNGEIVSAKYEAEVDMATRVHHFVAETIEGHVILGYVTIIRSDSKGFDIVGTGDFTVI